MGALKASSPTGNSPEFDKKVARRGEGGYGDDRGDEMNKYGVLELEMWKLVRNENILSEMKKNECERER